MQPLVITASCGFTRPPGAGEPAETLVDIANSAVESHRAGAAIVQVRVPMRIEAETGRPLTELGSWIELLDRIRNACDVLIHAGVGAMPVEQRIEMLDAVRPDFASFLLGHHDIVVRGRDLNSLRTRADALRLARGHVETGVQPDFEIFSAGSLWRLEQLLTDVAMPRPLALTLFFGWDGGEWSPPTVEELLHRVKLLPAEAEWSATVAGREQTAVHAVAIARAGHVRIGLGDYPYVSGSVLARSNAEMVAKIARLAAEFDRAVATPAQAATLLNARRPKAPMPDLSSAAIAQNR
jgi:3-keto-5-aminohexanoate cleavage enzyme